MTAHSSAPCFIFDHVINEVKPTCTEFALLDARLHAANALYECALLSGPDPGDWKQVLVRKSAINLINHCIIQSQLEA